MYSRDQLFPERMCDVTLSMALSRLRRHISSATIEQAQAIVQNRLDHIIAYYHDCPGFALKTFWQRWYTYDDRGLWTRVGRREDTQRLLHLHCSWY